jgi:molybdenum transport protein
MDLLYEDVGMSDLTTLGLGIGDERGSMSFAPKADIILSGLVEVEKIFKQCNLEYKVFKHNGEKVSKNEKIAQCKGDARSLHKAWKISQNIFEYCSGIATYTDQMSQKAKAINPDIIIATTRKNFPGVKELMIKAVLDGGGVAHRMGLYDSILIFKEHLEFIADTKELEQSIQKLQKRFLEKKVAIEVDSFQQAEYFASLGVDIIQCEKMDFNELEKCVSLKQNYPSLLVSATGGITLDNVEQYAHTGVDFIVTSSPYHAKPENIKVTIESNRSWLFIDSI